MPKITLNKYQKIGLILSLLWIVIVFLNVRNEQIESADTWGKIMFEECSQRFTLPTADDLTICEAVRQKNRTKHLEGTYEIAVGTAVIPLPFLWLLAFILFHVGKGIKIGYQAVVPWSTFTLKKKIYAGFCLFVIGFIGYVGLIGYMSIIADSRVPVSVSGSGGLQTWDGENVYFSGSWTKHGLSEGSGIFSPINLSKFQCIKKSMQCIEAQAYVSPWDSQAKYNYSALLSADLSIHDIDTWTDNEITYKEEGACATTSYTVDLKSGAVNGIGRLTNIGAKGCRPEGYLTVEAAKIWPDTSWTMTLTTDGFGVYWAEHKKAYPRLAKIIAPWL